MKELMIKIKADTSKVKSEVEKGQKSLKEFGEKAKQAGAAVGKAMKAAADVVGAAVKAVGAAVAAGVTAIIGLSEATAEYRTEQAKLATAFETAGASAQQASTTYNDLYRVLGDSGQAVEAASHLAKLTTNEQELAEWTTACQGIYATFGDSLPIEGLTEAANETAKVGQVTGGLADALNWAGISEDDFNAKLQALNTEAEREQLIRETLSSTYAEAAANYEKNAASVLAANEAQAKLSKSLGALGEAVAPIAAILKSGLADTLEKLVPYFEMVSGGLQDMINGVEGGAEKMSAGITGMLTTVVDKITSFLPTVVGIGVDIILALLDGIIAALPTLIPAVVSGLTTIIQGIVSAIPALIDAIVQAFGAIVEALPQIITAIVNALPTLIPQLITGLVTMLTTLLSNIMAILQPIIDALPSILMSIVDALITNLPVLLEGVINLIVGLTEALPEILLIIVDIIPELFAGLVVAIYSCLPQLIEGAIKLVVALAKSIPTILLVLWKVIILQFEMCWEAIKGVFALVDSWFGGIFTKAWELIKEVFSPVIEWFGSVFTSIKNVFSLVGSWFKDKFKEAVNKIKEVFNPLTTFFSETWNKIKSVFTKVGGAIGDAISGAVKGAINKVLSFATNTINKFISAINTAIGIINAIPGVSIKKLSKLSVPALAQGGIVDSATLALIGERGKEAVVPLENNTEWLDMLVARLSKANNGNTPIVLNVDGKVFAQTAISSINNLTRQTGNLALQLA